jgi:hypothetical protein
MLFGDEGPRSELGPFSSVLRSFQGLDAIESCLVDHHFVNLPFFVAVSVRAY